MAYELLAHIQMTRHILEKTFPLRHVIYDFITHLSKESAWPRIRTTCAHLRYDTHYSHTHNTSL